MNIVKALSVVLIAIVICNSSCEQQYNQGKVLYDFHCAGCHLEDGTGLGELYPPLTKNDYILEHREDLPCIITKGMKGEIVVAGKTYNGEMPLNKGLSAVEVNNIINYMNKVFNYGFETSRLDDTMKQLAKCEE